MQKINDEVPGSEFTVEEPILVTDENKAEINELVLPLLNQFVPDEDGKINSILIDGSFIPRSGKAFVTLVRNASGEVVGASGCKIDEAGVMSEDGTPLRLLYRSFTFMTPEVRGGGLYKKIQAFVNQIALENGVDYQVLRTQNGRVWETAHDSFEEMGMPTYPSPETIEDTPKHVLDIAQVYNMNKDADGNPINGPMHGLIAPSKLYGMLAPVPRQPKYVANAQFLEGILREAYEELYAAGIVNTEDSPEKVFDGMDSRHELSVMVVSRFPKSSEEAESESERG